MPYSVSTKPAVDGTGAAIPGGVVFVDESGAGSGPFIIGKATVDPNGVNAQLVLANGAAKGDLSSVNGVNLGSPSPYGTAPGAVNVPGVNAFITNTVAVSGAVTTTGTVAATQSGTWTMQQGTPPWSVSQSGAWSVTANQGGTWTVQQGTPPWSVSQSGAWTVTANAGTGTFTVGGTVAATQSGAWTVQQGTPPWSVSQSGAWTVTANAGTGTYTVAGTVAATQSGAWTVGQSGAPWSVRVPQSNNQVDYDTGAGVQNMTLWGLALPASGGAVAGGTATNPIRIDPTGTTSQPVSGTVTANAGSGTFTVGGTVTANQGAPPWLVSQSGTWTVQQGTPPWSVSQSGTWTVGQSGNWTSRVVGNAGGIMDAAGQNAASPANELLVAGQFNTTPTTITSGNVSPLQLDASGNLKVNVNASSGSTTVSGTVTANQGGTWTMQQGTPPWSVSQSGAWTVTANAGSGTFTVAGTVTANQGGAPWSQNITQVNGSAVTTSATGQMKVGVVGNAGGAFDAADGATAPANVLNVGGAAMTTLPTAVTAGQMANVATDKFGRQVTLPQTTRDNIGTQTTTITTTTETTIVTAGAAGIFNDVMMLIVSNTAASGSDTRIDFRMATAGTVIFSLMSRGGQQPVGFSMGGPAIPQATAAANWTAQLATAVTDIRVFAVFAKNQ